MILGGFAEEIEKHGYSRFYASGGDNRGMFQKSGFGPSFCLNDGCKQRQGGALEYLPDRHPQGSLPDFLSDHLTGF